MFIINSLFINNLLINNYLQSTYVLKCMNNEIRSSENVHVVQCKTGLKNGMKEFALLL